MEYFRLDDSGRLNDTQERLTSRGYGGDDNPFSAFQSWFGRPEGPNGFGFSRGYQSGPFFNNAGPGPGPGLGRPPQYVRPESRQYRQQDDPISRDRMGF